METGIERIKFAKIFKTALKFLRLAVSIGIIVVILINYKVNSYADIYSFSEIEKIPKTDAVLVLGAKVFNNGALSGMLQDRADTAVEIYKAGKADKILVSGDHGTKEYDEVNAVKKYLLEKDVKEEDLFLDYAGFDTYDSIYRAREIFQAKSVAIVSQNFHLPRAIYIAKGLGLNSYGVSADRHTYGNIELSMFREIFANVKAFMEVNLHFKPKFLGYPIPITGDGKKSWD